MSDPYPLLLRPVILEKVWGGRRLESLGKTLEIPGAKYGESWELADMASTSASGAGGGAVRTLIANGELRGKTLGDARAAWGAGLLGLRGTGVPPVVLGGTGFPARVSGASSSTQAELGAIRPEPAAAGHEANEHGLESPCHEAAKAHGQDAHATDFPLLIKFLDASENLSVQVHPSPEYAASRAGAFLKTECWYIIDAEPGAVIYKGLRPEVTREEFSRLARSGAAGGRALVDAMVALPAVPGECHNLPSGTVHALGAGVLVAEVQTPSDTTYRLYDWGRTGRALHVEESIACASFPGEPAHAALPRGMTVARCEPGKTSARLVTTEFFTVDELRPAVGDVLSVEAILGAGGSCVAIVVLDGECELVDGRAFQPVALKRGDTALIPAGIGPQTLLAAGSGLRVLAARVV